MHMSSYKIISLHYLMTLYTCFIWLRIGQYEIKSQKRLENEVNSEANPASTVTSKWVLILSFSSTERHNALLVFTITLCSYSLHQLLISFLQLSSNGNQQATSEHLVEMTLSDFEQMSKMSLKWNIVVHGNLMAAALDVKQLLLIVLALWVY